MNPELRHTLNTLSHNIEHANQAAQENIYTFTQLYIDPCLNGFKSCLGDFTAPCFSRREDNLRRRRARGRSRGQAEAFFDFYDDWADDEGLDGGAQPWGDDELDSLLARQPKRQRGMSYGSKSRRRPGPIQPSDAEEDPTIIPGSSYLGFLERLPFRIGARVLKYKPSAANLQEHPGAYRSSAESEPLLEEDGYGTVSEPTRKGHTRQRSSTQNSRATTNSLSSRGDLILSDEEDDAVALDDEFTVMLSRRNTNNDDQNSGKGGTLSGKRRLSRRSTQRTVSSKSTKSQKSSNHSTPSKRSRSGKTRNFTSPSQTSPGVEDLESFPSMQELRREEDDMRRQEELEIEQKRQQAHRLALERGLTVAAQPSQTDADDKSPIDIRTETIVEAGDDGWGETRSMTDVGDTDFDADAEDLTTSRDTLSSVPEHAIEQTTEQPDPASEHDDGNRSVDPP